jgi:hypothetical protein
MRAHVDGECNAQLDGVADLLVDTESCRAAEFDQLEQLRGFSSFGFEDVAL